jgi:hypothetical protein
VFFGKIYRWGPTYVECHMDLNISKATTSKERVVAACAESQSTSRGPNRTRFLSVQTTIRVKMQCDKKSLLAAADTSKKRNLMAVGGHADNAVDLCGEDSADANLLLMILSFGRTLSQPIVWGNHPCVYGQGNCTWKEGHHIDTIAIHSLGKLFQRQTRGWMKRACPG